MLSEPVLEAMRTIRKRSNSCLATCYSLSPRGGQVAAGSEHTRAFQQGESLAAFLRVLGKEQGVDAAVASGKAEGNLIAEKWNSQRRKDFTLHIWDGAADSIVEWAWRLVLDAERAAVK